MHLFMVDRQLHGKASVLNCDEMVGVFDGSASLRAEEDWEHGVQETRSLAGLDDGLCKTTSVTCCFEQ